MSLEEVSRKSPAPPASPPRMDSWARGGRRTKRRGGGSGSFGGAAESEDEYVALCLVMMARGVRGDAEDVKGIAAVAAPRKPHGYECSVCGKVYASYQALGGHKTSHRKPPAPPAQAAPAGGGGGGDEASAGGAVAEARVHRCSLCDRTFPSGQALGGHKRLHYEGGAEGLGGGKDKEAAKAKAAALLRDFDLNLPAAAAVAGDEPESAPPEAKRARTAMLSGCLIGGGGAV